MINPFYGQLNKSIPNNEIHWVTVASKIAGAFCDIRKQELPDIFSIDYRYMTSAVDGVTQHFFPVIVVDGFFSLTAIVAVETRVGSVLTDGKVTFAYDAMVFLDGRTSAIKDSGMATCMKLPKTSSIGKRVTYDRDREFKLSKESATVAKVGLWKPILPKGRVSLITKEGVLLNV